MDFIKEQILARLAMFALGIGLAAVGLINPNWALDALYGGMGVKK